MDTRNPQVVRAQEIKRTKIIFVSVSLIVLLLYIVPYGWYALYPLMLLSTFVHEMGHGITAWLAGGEFLNFKMWADGSGVASYAMPVNAGFMAMKSAAVAAGGLLAPPIFALFLFLFSGREKMSRAALVLCALMSALSVIFVVRNLFGIIFVIGVGVLCGLAARFGSKAVTQSMVLLGAISMTLMSFSRSDYLFTAEAQTSMGPMPSDVSQIADNLFLPYWFWGGVVAFLSLMILYLGGKFFFWQLKTAQNGNKKQNKTAEYLPKEN